MVLVFVMVRDPVWWSSSSLFLNLSVPSLHWTSVQNLHWSSVISAMQLSLKYHIFTSFVFFITPGSKVKCSPSFTHISSRAAAETQSNSCWRIFWRWKIITNNYAYSFPEKFRRNKMNCKIAKYQVNCGYVFVHMEVILFGWMMQLKRKTALNVTGIINTMMWFKHK